MMNKKAIAAFAAGATLLAGFAMATPAFAAETPKCTPVAADKLAELKKAVTEAKRKADKAERTLADEKDKYAEDTEAYNTAKGLVDAFKQAVKNYDAAKKAADGAAGKDDEGAKKDAAKKAAKEVNKAAAEAKKNEKLKTATFTDIVVDGTAAAPADTTFDTVLGAAPTKHEIYEAEVSLREANGALQDAKDALAKAQCTPAPAPQTTKPGEAKPVVPGVHVKAADKAKAVEAVKTAKLHLDDAFAAYTKDYAEYEKAKATLAGKVAAQEAAEKALKAAQDALEAYNVSAKNDSALAQRLADAVDRAQAKVVFAVAETAKANKDYVEAKAKAVASTAKYNAALAEYKACYNDAVTFGVEASQLPPVVTSDPLAPNFEDVPGATKAMNDAASGKLGKAAQQAAAKNAPAAAKGELAAKGAKGHGKSGEKLGNAGVGVALTALAASMLAGMGAAVRKMRH
ncbi:hypothetical protein [Gardnerella vaginalis]|uniref:hypothetical protein n=1 Tax=Gardnerella vaginalis TaxID=2702 RepID=UPI000C9F73A4|nr:hypothetical protein [Gardnerella vaginalis]PNP87012.1 hypothetical protein BFS12_05960 [Gardnerella vaginalis]